MEEWELTRVLRENLHKCHTALPKGLSMGCPYNAWTSQTSKMGDSLCNRFLQWVKDEGPKWGTHSIKSECPNRVFEFVN